MGIREALAVYDTIPDLFAQMEGGETLGTQVREVVRRLHRVRSEAYWSVGQAVAANRLRARVAVYAHRYAPDGGCPVRRARNEARLEEVRAAFLEVRSHLLQRAELEGCAVPAD